MPRTILISGASRGIGLHCALGLRQRGYRVFAGTRTQADAEKLQQQGLETVLLDLNDSNSIAHAVATVLERSKGVIDVLFNNAGYGQLGAVEDLPRSMIRAQFETNVFGTIELTNHVIPIMRKQGYGRIIMNSSVVGLAAIAYRGAYSASKFALEGFTDTLRQELQDSGIQVALLEPGPIESDFHNNTLQFYQQQFAPLAAHSVHKTTYENIAASLVKNTSNSGLRRASPQLVLESLIEAIEQPRAKTRYYITPVSYFVVIIKHLLPTRWFDRLMRHVVSGEYRRSAR